MNWIYFLLCMGSSLVLAQEKSLLLELTGRVTSEAGMPIAGVEVLADAPSLMANTNAEGTYVLRVIDSDYRGDCCIVSFRSPGYQMLTKAVNLGYHQLDVTLQSSENKWAPERCTVSMEPERVGFVMKLKAPKDAIVQKVFDTDHYRITMRFGSKKKREYIEMGTGPIWSTGCPDKSRLVSSTDIQEREMVIKGWSDFRGRDQRGKRWRYTGHVGETITYQDVSDKTADYFDSIIDSMCIDPSIAMPPRSLDDYQSPTKK